MKSLSTVKFITEATVTHIKHLEIINNSESYEKARDKANVAIGYIDGITTFLNCMICKENNDLTEELSDVLSNWQADILQAVAEKADKEGNSEKAMELFKMRDEIRVD